MPFWFSSDDLKGAIELTAIILLIKQNLCDGFVWILLMDFLHLTYPEVCETIGAPQKTSQPTSSIPPCPRPLSGPHPVSGLSILGCCPPISFSVCLSLSVPALCLVRLSCQALLTLLHVHTTSVWGFALWSGGHQKARWIADFFSSYFLIGDVVFVRDAEESAKASHLCGLYPLFQVSC